tara:strand:+ start:50 stop:370 length:321 start_codon:yes stop_codon:yes gene_type:complete
MTVKEAPNVHRDAEDRKKEWLKEIIPFEFFNLEEPGVPIKFSFGPTNKTKTYTMLHGGKYNYPREVVQHLESRQTPIWGYKPDGSGKSAKNLEGYRSRFQCRQLFE